jgi:hypothetical protein
MPWTFNQNGHVIGKKRLVSQLGTFGKPRILVMGLGGFKKMK